MGWRNKSKPGPRFVGSSPTSVEDAIKNATKGKRAHWYKVDETKVYDDGQPSSITEYHVVVSETTAPTSPPPP